jgi:TATA-box binding protein (TBP) (component of TFIID and TFIIIB)
MMGSKLDEFNNFLKEHSIKISTMTVDCKLKTPVNIELLAKYLVIRKTKNKAVTNNIIDILFGDRTDKTTNYISGIIKHKKKKVHKKTTGFYAQLTIYIQPKKSNNIICTKLYKNGTLHMTGCKNTDDVYSVAKQIKFILEKNITTKKGIILKFTDATPNISNMKIEMINSDYNTGFSIDRKSLARILKKNHSYKNNSNDNEIGYVEYSYDPNSPHACIGIIYHSEFDTTTSIFIFKTGSIIMTGAKTVEDIKEAYYYVEKILKTYRNDIEIKEIDMDMYKKLMDEYVKNKKLSKEEETDIQKYADDITEMKNEEEIMAKIYSDKYIRYVRRQRKKYKNASRKCRKAGSKRVYKPVIRQPRKRPVEILVDLVYD